MNERLFIVAVVKKNRQTGVSILEDGQPITANGLYFDRDLPFMESTKAYGDFILERIAPDEHAVIATSYAAAKSKKSYPFTLNYRSNRK